MSFMDRVAACNQADLSGYLPLCLNGQRIGHVRNSLASRLAGWPEVFNISDEAVTLTPQFESEDCENRTAVFAEVTSQLRVDGFIHGWRDELHRVSSTVDAPAHFHLERAAIPYFGVGGHSVHINGLVNDAGKIGMWVAKRSVSKPTYPGLLDQMVAGGLPADQSLMGNVIKESQEEAGVKHELASTAQAHGFISYTMETAPGVRPDTVHVYDLLVPPAFKPQVTDGEVESFELWDLDSVAECVRDTESFKPNCALVIIDYLIRKCRLKLNPAELSDIKRALRPHEQP